MFFFVVYTQLNFRKLKTQIEEYFFENRKKGLFVLSEIFITDMKKSFILQALIQKIQSTVFT